MSYTSPFKTGALLDDSAVQTVVNAIYSARAARGLSNNTKPTFSEGDPVRASTIKTVISNYSGILYDASIMPTIEAGTPIKAYDMRCIEQYQQDLTYLRSCNTGCVGACWESCSGSGCSNNGCSGNCAKGCGNYCTGCSGTVAWGCVAKCGSGCSGTGSCKGACTGKCANACSSACISRCDTICTNGCKASCTDNCANTNRIGSINYWM